MQVPLTVSFHGLQVSEGVRAACWHEAEKLEHYFDRIVSCHVTVARPHQRQRSGNHFDLHVRVCVPGHEIVVDRSPSQRRTDEVAAIAVHEAFDEVRRKLQDCARRMRGEIKQHG